MSFSGMTAVSQRIARERGRRWCDKCGEWLYVAGDDAALERHKDTCEGKYRYKCPVHGWRTLSRSAILRDHGPCDPSLTVERLAKMKGIKRSLRRLARRVSLSSGGVKNLSQTA